MAVASGSGRRVSAKKPRLIEVTPIRPRSTCPSGRVVWKALARLPFQARKASTGSMAKKERKNTICPEGTVWVALSMVAMTTKQQTEATLRAMPRSGSPLAGLAEALAGSAGDAVTTVLSGAYLPAASSFSLAMRAVAKALCSGPTALPDLTTLPDASCTSQCQLVLAPTPPARRSLI